MDITFVADIASIFMAAIAAFIAIQAHAFARRTTQMNFILSSTDILNKINEVSISTPGHMEALLRLRPGVSDDIEKDYLALMNLNYLHCLWNMREEKLVPKELANSKLENGVGFLLQSSEDYVRGLLKRGFPEAFQEEMFGYFEAQRSAIPA